MNVAELVATLVVDASGFQSEIRKADAALTQTGQKAASMSDAVSQSVENSTNKAAQSFAKLAKTANSTLNSGLSQWDGTAAVHKAAKAVTEQAALLEKAGMPEQGAENKPAHLASGLDRAQAKLASRLPQWLGDAVPEMSAGTLPDVSGDFEKAPMPTSASPSPEATAGFREKAGEIRESAPKAEAHVATLPASAPLSTPASVLPSALAFGERFGSRSLPQTSEGMEDVAAAVSAALRHAIERVSESIVEAPVTLAENLPKPPARSLPEWPEKAAVPPTMNEGTGDGLKVAPLSHLFPALELSELLQTEPASSSVSPPVLPADLALSLPPVLLENFSESMTAHVGIGVTETAEAISAMAPQAAESFARSGAQLAQSVLNGLQKSVNAVLEHVPMPTIPASSPQTDPARESGATNEDAAQSPNASAFPASIFEPLAVTPPKAESFAAAVGNTISSQTSISQITIHSQATDAEGIADDIGSELERRNMGYQFDGAYSI